MARIFNRGSEKSKRRVLRNEMTPAEKRLWLKLRASQFLGMRWRRQYSVGPYILDFYCPVAKLAVELDGDSHFGEGAEEYDAQRQGFVEGKGIRMVRFLNQDVYQRMPMVLETIAEAAKQATPESTNTLTEQTKRRTPLSPPLLRGEGEDRP